MTSSSSSLRRGLSADCVDPDWYIDLKSKPSVIQCVTIAGWDEFLAYVKEQSENGNFDGLIGNTGSKAKTPDTWPTIKSLPFQICGKTFTLNVHVQIFRGMVSKQLAYGYGVFLEHIPYKEQSLFATGLRVQIMDQVTGEWLSGGANVNYHTMTFSFSTVTGFESKLDRGWRRYYPFNEEDREACDDKPPTVFDLNNDITASKTNPFEQQKGNLRFKLSFWLHYSHSHAPTAVCIICYNPLYQFVSSKACCHENICADCFFEMVERNNFSTTFACPVCRVEGRWVFKSQNTEEKTKE